MINVELSQHDVYDFNIKHAKIIKEVVNNKTVVSKYKEAVFKRDDIMKCRVQRFDKPNAPEILKNVETILAPFPFYKTFGDKYESFEWSIATAMYAFKHGLIDGFYFYYGGLFSPFWEMHVNAFIVIDPIKRIEIRNYIEKEFKEFIEKANDEDFEYGIQISTSMSSRRIGKDKERSLDEWLNHIKDDHQKAKESGEEYYTAPNEKIGLEKYGEEKLDYALATMLYYKYDFGERNHGERNVEPLSFKTLKEAEDFCTEYNKQSEIYGGRYINAVEMYKRKAFPMIINDKFEKSIADYYETVFHKESQKEKENLNKLKGGKDIPATGIIGEMK